MLGFGLLSSSFGMLGDLAAMPEAEMAQRNYALARQYSHYQIDYRALQNYRPPVHVPEGWADWVAVGDELH